MNYMIIVQTKELLLFCNRAIPEFQKPLLEQRWCTEKNCQVN